MWLHNFHAFEVLTNMFCCHLNHDIPSTNTFLLLKPHGISFNQRNEHSYSKEKTNMGYWHWFKFISACKPLPLLPCHWSDTGKRICVRWRRRTRALHDGHSLLSWNTSRQHAMQHTWSHAERNGTRGVWPHWQHMPPAGNTTSTLTVTNILRFYFIYLRTQLIKKNQQYLLHAYKI